MSTNQPPPDQPAGPEYLERGSGDPVPPSSSSRGGGRRTALIAGGAVALLAAAGAGTWAAISFLGGGAQAADALPGDTLAYASVDLDPSGSQKIEAVRMLNKFPAFREEYGLDAADDVRRKIFDAFECDGLRYDDDVAPWIGSTFAVAAVDAGEEQPSPFGLLEVTDASGAEEGLGKLAECEGEGNGGGFVVEGDWAYVAETEKIARSAADGAAESTLSDSAEHQQWMDEIGDLGVMNMYAAPASGEALATLMGPDLALGGGEAMPPDMKEKVSDYLSGFKGGAATVRFADGGVELDLAYEFPVADMGILAAPAPLADGDLQVVDRLPDDTAFAYGGVLPDAWAQSTLDLLVKLGVPQEQIDSGLAQAEAQTGLSLPEDVETLLGDQLAVSFGGDFDIEALVNSGDPASAPFGVTVQGDPPEVERIMGQLGTSSGMPQWFETETEGDQVFWSINPDYRSALKEGGSLGETDAFRDVVAEGDQASTVLFVDFDAGDWLTSLAEGDQEAQANLEPLRAAGISGRIEDGTTRQVVRVTTD